MMRHLNFNNLTFNIWLPYAASILFVTVVIGVYYPSRQEELFRADQLEVLNHLSRTVALGVEISLELEDFEAVERDTEHILELLDFVQDFAAQEDIGQSFQQFRPQTIMMQVRAVGTELIADGKYDSAIAEIIAAIEELNLFYTEMGREELVDSSMEVRSLGEWLNDVEKEAAEKKPMTKREKLEHKLGTAINQEDYEAAAKLRDQLKKIGPKKNG